ncbi:MAG: hypothetical protein AAFR04_13850 [Pseudomonadota bacterium]
MIEHAPAADAPRTDVTSATMPRGVFIALCLTLISLLGGAVFLLAQRGPAILLDLGSAVGQVLCF